MVKKQGIEKVYIHTFLDGRDVPPSNAKVYLRDLSEKLEALQLGKVATVMGRYYAMDRDKRWDRVEKAYRGMVYGEGLTAKAPVEAVDASYERKETDEFVQPTVIIEGNQPVATVQDDDGVIFFNFRPDRAREITRAFVDEEFSGFERGEKRPRVHFTCMTQYDVTIEAEVAFKPQVLVNTLGEVLSKNGMKQLRIAETEKYAHVTFFFNGGVEVPNPGEERILIPSAKVATYDLQPEMSANEITEKVIEAIDSDKFDVIIMNYANPDMVGHTGVMAATVKAVETVDQCLGQVVDKILSKDGTVLITADHGNAEEMMDLKNGQPQTAHSINPVPFLLISKKLISSKINCGSLQDISPTILKLIGINPPKEMTGKYLY
jgi:2,3-bisphosphoglycerate-independent phosphoglycerate mutase